MSFENIWKILECWPYYITYFAKRQYDEWNVKNWSDESREFNFKTSWNLRRATDDIQSLSEQTLMLSDPEQ